MAKEFSEKRWGTGNHSDDANLRIYRSFYKTFQEALDNGIQKDCFATKFFEIADGFGFDQDQQMFVAGTLIEAGKFWSSSA
jgi:hypothetical protein